MSRQRPISIFLFVFVVWSAASCAIEDGITVEKVWLRETPPTVKITAAYLTLANHTNQPVKLTQITSPLADKIEIHETRQEKDMARMIPHESITLKPGEVVEFAPNGYHLMFYASNPLPRADSLIPLTLSFDNGLKISIDGKVKRGQGDSEHHHHHHH